MLFLSSWLTVMKFEGLAPTCPADGIGGSLEVADAENCSRSISSSVLTFYKAI
jgi:hypothetical protein